MHTRPLGLSFLATMSAIQAAYSNAMLINGVALYITAIQTCPLAWVTVVYVHSLASNAVSKQSPVLYSLHNPSSGFITEPTWGYPYDPPPPFDSDYISSSRSIASLTLAPAFITAAIYLCLSRALSSSPFTISLSSLRALPPKHALPPTPLISISSRKLSITAARTDTATLPSFPFLSITCDHLS